MIRCIIFSKDRAMQLQAVLRSFFLHCNDINIIHISVLYTCSSEQHTHQYMQLKKEWEGHPNVAFVQQKHFRDDVFKILNPYPAKSFSYWFFENLSHLHHRLTYLLTKLLPTMDTSYIILFLVDDAVCVHDFCMIDVMDALRDHSDSLAFSLRLGRNTTFCYMNNVAQHPPDFIPVDNNVLKFNWIDADQDFGYPLEVSSSAYRAIEVLPLLLMIKFNNPNHLEGGMNLFKDVLASQSPALLCFKKSVAFCNPVNKVQTIAAKNHAGLVYSYNTEELAEKFDRGKRIDVQFYSGFVSNSCHQEVELIFTSQK